MILRLLFVLGSLWCAHLCRGPEWGDQLLACLFVLQAKILTTKAPRSTKGHQESGQA